MELVHNSDKQNNRNKIEFDSVNLVRTNYSASVVTIVSVSSKTSTARYNILSLRYIIYLWRIQLI